MESKKEASSEKITDKASANPKKMVWTMDLQAVLLCPKSNASSLYYKTKLQIHNFTLYNLESKDGYCYVWNEMEGDLSKETFAFLQYNHFDRVFTSHPEVKELVIWNDGYGYQNRNAKVSNAYGELAKKHSMCIVQKFLVAGHTQMEWDSIHSVIERKLQMDIFTNSHYVRLMREARINSKPYHARPMSYHEFKKMKNVSLQSIRPGKRVGDPTVHDLRGLQYLPDGVIEHKLSFSPDTEWKRLEQKVSNANEVKWREMFPNRIPITKRKFDDLQAMKHVIPPIYHDFFDNLPCSNI